ncbi:MAG: MFS transporter [Ilumatobacter sp.]|uniref:MFS transporter n=1 Tax=Ilumatobacter sp. TaxID=1967498 RepID=UPI002633D732|nr:MFS transporter [Ilumatobacter sp.]MDJ0768776.1 MFS transporter [Ilumatobacter sp.]
MRAPGVRRDALLPLYLVSLIGALGFSIVLPFLVFLIEEFGGNAFVYGLVGATYPAFQFVGAPVLGRWSDRMGRRKVLLISQLGTLASWVLFAIALFLPVDAITDVSMPVLGDFTLTVPLLVVFVARAVDGLTGGNVSVANAYVADVSTEDTRARNFGRMGVAFSTGMIGGPALASVLGVISTSTKLPVFAAMLIAAVTAVIIYVALPESSPCTGDLTSPEVSAFVVQGREHRDCHYAAQAAEVDKEAPLAQTGVRFTLGLQFAILLAFNLYYAAFPVYAATELDWSVQDVGLYFSILAGLLVVVEGPVLSRVSKRFTEWQLVVAGLVVMAVHFLVLMVAEGNQVYAATALFAIGNGIMWPSVSSFLSSLASAPTQGTVQGFAGSVSSLASIVGLLIGGAIFTSLEGGVFGLSGVVMFFSALLAVHLRSYSSAVPRAPVAA